MGTVANNPWTTEGPATAAPSGAPDASTSAAPGALLSPDQLREQAATLEEAVNTVFLDSERGRYRDPGEDSYRQTSNLLPLAFHIVPEAQVEAVVAHLVADIEARGDHHDCGHIGLRHLLPVLSEHGHGALAMRVLGNPTAPGWKAWLDAGNSTFMEMWQDPALLLPLLHGHSGHLDP